MPYLNAGYGYLISLENFISLQLQYKLIPKPLISSSSLSFLLFGKIYFAITSFHT